MYYERLKTKVKSFVQAKQAVNEQHTDIQDCIASCYLPLHEDVQEGKHSIFHLPGGRGSAKSSFISLEIVDGIMKDPAANGIVFRKYKVTLRESVYSQISWAIDVLGVSHLWRGTFAPMMYTYIPTGQQIIFRGLDDAGKLKSIRPRRGTFKFVWFEEFSELDGANQVRNVLQSVVRGGNDFRIFNSFNPPLSLNSWANKYVLIPDDRAITFRTNYTMIPPEWLGEAFLLEADQLKRNNEKAYRHEYLGEAVGTGGQVFPNLEIRKITDDEIDKMQYFYCGLDWGFSVDPAAFIRCSYDSKTQTVYLLDEIVKRGCSNAEIASYIKEKNYHLAASGINHYSPFTGETTKDRQLIICDAAEPKSIQDLRKLNILASPCMKYQGSVNYGIKWLQSRHIVVDPQRTPTAFAEFSEYEYEKTKDGEFLASVPDKNNHLIDGVRYALDMIINNAKYSA